MGHRRKTCSLKKAGERRKTETGVSWEGQRKRKGEKWGQEGSAEMGRWRVQGQRAAGRLGGAVRESRDGGRKTEGQEETEDRDRGTEDRERGTENRGTGRDGRQRSPDGDSDEGEWGTDQSQPGLDKGQCSRGFPEWLGWKGSAVITWLTRAACTLGPALGALGQTRLH